MGRALELISGRVTAPGAVITALTMNGTDTATVRFAAIDSDVRLLQYWARNQVAGISRIRSPRLHDNVQGIRERIPAASPIPLMPRGAWQKLIPQDALTLELSGSAVAGQIEHLALLLYYANLPGIDAAMIAPDELMRRAVNEFTVETNNAPGVTGDYTGSLALNANFDLLKANTPYALIGYAVDAQATAITVKGPDTGNVRVGGPGNLQLRHITKEWFLRHSLLLGLPLIPVINSANKAGTFVEVVQDQAGGAVNVTLHMAELSGGVGAGAPAR